MAITSPVHGCRVSKVGVMVCVCVGGGGGGGEAVEQEGGKAGYLEFTQTIE